MKKISALVLSVSVLFISSVPSLAADSARSLGMAGAVVAIPGDIYSPLINPAVLSKMNKRSAGWSASSIRQRLNASPSEMVSDASELNYFENIGFVQPLTVGSLYVGYDSYKNFFGGIKNIALGADVDMSMRIYAPTIAYGVKVSPALSLGASLSYIYKAYNFQLDQKSAGYDIPMYKISRGMAANFGALYSLNPKLDLGASLYLAGPYQMNGYVDVSTLGAPPLATDYVISGHVSNPSTWRFGGNWRPQDNLSVGLQFDVLNGFKLQEVQGYDSDFAKLPMDTYAEAVTVVGTRIGVEYNLAVPDAVVPLRMGFNYVPDNRMRYEPFTLFGGGFDEIFAAAEDAGIYSEYKVPLTSTFSLGCGYRRGPFEFDVASQWLTGASTVKGKDSQNLMDYLGLEQRVVISGKMDF